MSDQLRIALAQINPIVGNIQYNLAKHIKFAKIARDKFAADIIVFPELSLTGYPPEDLLLRPQFIKATEEALEEFLGAIQNIYCCIGHPYADDHGIFNACSMVYNGKILGRYDKQCLPNYGVFDEHRYFVARKNTCIINIKNMSVGIVICEDLWLPGPVEATAKEGAQLIISPNASPFEVDKHERRLDILSTRAKHNAVPIFYVNLIGGQDELVFDGGSMVVDKRGHLEAYIEPFREALVPVEINSKQEIKTLSQSSALPNKLSRTYQALMLGLKDYVEKNQFASVIVGLSGGIDSALTLAIAVDALGHDRVNAIYMPSRYSATLSFEEAKLTAEALHVPLEVISIEPMYDAFLQSLQPAFKNKSPDTTEENIQARIRAIILMALSNKFGHLVLTTGNRSELAVGYCTLYGDMAGGFAVLKDVPKTLVYELVHYRNKHNIVIPKRTIERAPSAELAPNQKDEDNLPPYAILDQILEFYLNQSQSINEIVKHGFDQAIVEKIVTLIRRNEYKRKQAAIGTRINHKSFGKDWRYPLTNGFKG